MTQQPSGVRSLLLIQQSPLWHGTLTLDRLLEEHPHAQVTAVVAPSLVEEFSCRRAVKRLLSPSSRREWRKALETIRQARPEVAVVCYASACMDEYLKADSLALASGARRVFWSAPNGTGIVSRSRFVVKLFRRLGTMALVSAAFYPLALVASLRSKGQRLDADRSSFTGERTRPDRAEHGEFQDHLARYRYAGGFAKGGRVLDLGCGDGYGSALLAELARVVISVDVSERAVRDARQRYRRDNLHFAVMDATELALASEEFDLVCAFEVIEHVDDREEFLVQLRRLLRPGGLLLLSTPNKRIFSPGMSKPPNPFHRIEFLLPEFSALLGRYFSHVELRGMRNRAQRTMDTWRYLDALVKGIDLWRLEARLEQERQHWIQRALARIFRTKAAIEVGPDAYTFEGPDPETSECFVAVATREG
ncbi:MAG TPA: class I SAM-dependent methyltransferase [Methylomirabilota bacterium]|nr:class I SAM-dependent methyltransferase [Methylomirabilota bacterium]